VVFVVGLSGIAINIGQVQLKGMSLAAVVGMALGLIMYLLDKYKLTNEYEDPDMNDEVLKSFSSDRRFCYVF
jgi:uracil permease